MLRVTGALLFFSVGTYPDFRQRQGCGYDFTFLVKRENDFNLSGQLTILKSQLEELAISFGEILMPMIRNVVSKIQAFVDKLNGMSDAQRETIIKVLALVAALGPLLVIIGKTISTVGVALQGFSKLGKGVLKLSTAVSNAGGMITSIWNSIRDICICLHDCITSTSMIQINTSSP